MFIDLCSTKKGEIREILDELCNPKLEIKRDAVKRVIALMTVGKDVSMVRFFFFSCYFQVLWWQKNKKQKQKQQQQMSIFTKCCCHLVHIRWVALNDMYRKKLFRCTNISMTLFFFFPPFPIYIFQLPFM